MIKIAFKNKPLKGVDRPGLLPTLPVFIRDFAVASKATAKCVRS